MIEDDSKYIGKVAHLKISAPLVGVELESLQIFAQIPDTIKMIVEFG